MTYTWNTLLERTHFARNWSDDRHLALPDRSVRHGLCHCVWKKRITIHEQLFTHTYIL